MYLVIGKDEESYIAKYISPEDLENLWMTGKVIFKLYSDCIFKFQGLEKWEEVDNYYGVVSL